LVGRIRANTVLVSYHPTPEQIEAAAGRPVLVGSGQLSPDNVAVAQWNDRGEVEARVRNMPERPLS